MYHAPVAFPQHFLVELCQHGSGGNYMDEDLKDSLRGLQDHLTSLVVQLEETVMREMKLLREEIAAAIEKGRKK